MIDLETGLSADYDPTLPPHVPQAEASVLGSVLRSDRAMQKLAGLKPEDFYALRNRQVFAAMQALHSESEPIDFTTLSDRLERNHPGAGNWVLTLSELHSMTPTAAHVEHYASIVQRSSTNRQLISVSSEIAAFAYRDQLDPQAAYAKALSLLQSAVRASGRSRLISPEEWAGDTLDALDKYLTGQVAGISLPWWEADRMVGPLEPTTVTLLGARMKAGKSSIGWQTADAAQARGPVLYATQEMNAVRLGIRYVAAKTGVRRMAIRRGWVDRADRELMADELRKAAGGNLWLYFEPGCTAADVKNKALELAGQEGHVALVVEDYLQLLTDKLSDRSRPDQNVTYAFSKLQELAAEVDCPVLCMAQFKRRENEAAIPTMADFAESDGPARNADVLLAMHRPDVVGGPSGVRVRPGEMDLYLLASRDASWSDQAKATLRWEGEIYVDSRPNPEGVRAAA